MDERGEGEGGEWELIHNDDDEPVVSDATNLALIRPDHFSIDSTPNSNSSCNSNSSSDEVDRNFDDSFVANQLFPNPNPQRWTHDSDSDSITTDPVKETEDSASAAAASSESEEVEVGVGFDSKVEGEEVKAIEKEEDRRVVWWRVPFEVLRYWVNPIPLSLPLCSVAAAAAFLGLLFLGRRLYKMKRKTQTMKLNLALDDKKVSQLMVRVARLNEAFSVVRRVPVVRPTLPASTATLRPVMSMR
ncbi:uncharacterized protein LOC130745573 [Lotus japonicus]|uniref:DUF6821 domain-containing protein n=1 Tax=Lotus japonicus TaxID=34305 RepID=I3T2A2_LOTJA|nr:uncharacterized protein LOC130745573 [Lotus japonicus]AFK46644.1 unknown [Lotus japonicus]